MALVAFCVILSIVIVLASAVHSCDVDQYNDPGRFTATIGFNEVEAKGHDEGISIRFSYHVNNRGDTPIIGYAFAWVECGGLPSSAEGKGMWPADVHYRDGAPPPPKPGQLQRGSPAQDFKDGYRLEVPANQDRSVDGTLVIPVEWSRMPPGGLLEPQITLIIYDVFGYEMMRIHYPPPHAERGRTDNTE